MNKEEQSSCSGLQQQTGPGSSSAMWPSTSAPLKNWSPTSTRGSTKRQTVRRTLQERSATWPRAKGLAQWVNDTGLSRESLYRAPSAEENVGLSTILKVVKALGVKLHAAAA